MDPVTLAVAKRYARSQAGAVAPLARTHRILVVEPSHTHYHSVLGADDAFRGGLLLEACSFEALVENVSEWKHEFDVLFIWTFELDWTTTASLESIRDAIIEFGDAGGKIFVQEARDGQLRRRFNGNDERVTMRTYFGITPLQRNMTAGTGTWEQHDDLGVDVRRPNMGPPTGNIFTYSSSDPQVVFPIKAVQDDLTAYPVAFKPGAFCIMTSGGTTGGSGSGTSAMFKYVRTDILLRLLIGNTTSVRLALDAKDGRKIASTGVDCDQTTDTEAILAMREAFGHNRPLGLSVVARDITPELSGFYRNVPGRTSLCSHTYSHYNDRTDVVDEEHVVGADRFIRLRRPYRARIASITDAGGTPLAYAGTMTFTRVVQPGQWSGDITSDSTMETGRGLLCFNEDMIGQTVRVSYSTLTNEFRETVGSLPTLAETGCLTTDAVYLTGGNQAVHPHTKRLADERGVLLLAHGADRSYDQAWHWVKGMMGRITLPISPLFKWGYLEHVRDTTIFTYSKAFVKTTLVPEAIAFCNQWELPFHWYDHDFPWSRTNSNSLWVSTTRWDADWKKGTYEETIAYASEMVAWLCDQLDAQNVIWMAREEYGRRLEYMERHVAYDAVETDTGFTITIENRGDRAIPGLTFRFDAEAEPASVRLRGGSDLPHSLAGGVCAAWLDVPAGGRRVVEVVTA